MQIIVFFVLLPEVLDKKSCLSNTKPATVQCFFLFSFLKCYFHTIHHFIGESEVSEAFRLKTVVIQTLIR